MTQDEMMEIFQAAIMLAFKLAVPILLVAMSRRSPSLLRLSRWVWRCLSLRRG